LGKRETKGQGQNWIGLKGEEDKEWKMGEEQLRWEHPSKLFLFGNGWAGGLEDKVKD